VPAVVVRVVPAPAQVLDLDQVLEKEERKVVKELFLPLSQGTLLRELIRKRLRFWALLLVLSELSPLWFRWYMP
jgi:hypothetical protein